MLLSTQAVGPEGFFKLLLYLLTYLGVEQWFVRDHLPADSSSMQIDSRNNPFGRMVDDCVCRRLILSLELYGP